MKNEKQPSFLERFKTCGETDTTPADSAVTEPRPSRAQILTGRLLLAVSLVLACVGIVISLTCTNREPVALTPLPDPMETVGCFFDGICNQDYAAAYACLNGYETLGLENIPEDATAAAFWNLVRENTSWEPASDCSITGTTASVDVAVTAPDLKLLTATLGDDVNTLLELRADEALDPTEIYDENNNFRSELVMELYGNALQALFSQENPAMSTKTVTISMIYSNKEWKITPDSTLFSALTGGVS